MLSEPRPKADRAATVSIRFILIPVQIASAGANPAAPTAFFITQELSH